MEFIEKNAYYDDARHERAFRGWARAGGILFAVVTLLSMAYSADWKLGMMVIDPLVWMMALVALASGLVSGYAFGVRLHASQGD